MAEDQQLHHGADHIDAKGRPQHLRDEEKPRPGTVRPHAEAVVEVFVERHHLQAVERGNQHESDDQLSDREARDHLHVGKAVYGDRAGNGDERHARHGGADHGEGGHVPRRAAVAGEKPGVVGAAAGDPCYGEEDGYVAQNGSDNGGGCHKRKFRFELQIYEKSPEKAGKKSRIMRGRAG